MARALRIEYPGGGGERMFLDDADFTEFVDLLKATAEMFHMGGTAYCLMSNYITSSSICLRTI